MGITPGRTTRLLLNVPEPQLRRPSHTERRTAVQIKPYKTPTGLGSSGTRLQPGGAWTLGSLAEELTSAVTTDGNALVLKAADVTLGAGWATVNTHRKQTDLTGLGTSSSVISAGAPAFQKRVAAGTSWAAAELSADAAAYPKPTLDTADIPMDRVVVGKATYPENAGFSLAFTIPPDRNSADNIATFYFGGPVDTLPRDSSGGAFALTIRGSGKAILWERSGGAWQRRMEFTWLTGTPGPGSLGLISVQPYGRDSLAIWAGGGGWDQYESPFTAIGTVMTIGAVIGARANALKTRQTTFYRNSPVQTGFLKPRFMTGAGTVRLDVRRDLRQWFRITYLKPLASGTVVDLPFWHPYPLTANTHMALTSEVFRPEGTTVTAEMYDATDGSPLLPSGSTGFLSTTSQGYFVRYTLEADSSQKYSPALYGYQVEVAGAYQDRSPTLLTGGAIQRVSVTGPDTDPTHDAALVQVEDPYGVLSTLRTRARHRAAVGVYTDAGALYSILADGEVSRATATYRAKDGAAFPGANWWGYDVSLVGVWQRLQDQINMDLVDFSRDPTAPVDPRFGTQPPWKVTTVIAILLERLGFPADTRAIPDLPLRFWATGGGADLLLQPTQSAAELLLTLARDYLGRSLVWCPNSGTRGMWRLVGRPTLASPVLAAFGGESPVAAPRLEGYTPIGSAIGVIEADTYQVWVNPPECNYVQVRGVADPLPGAGGPSQIAAYMWNPNSFDFTGATSNANHPDYLGRFVPLLRVDFNITTYQAAQWVCRQLYDRAAHAEQWAQFRAPLLFVTDGTDPYLVRPRPLRINDLVSVYGSPAVVRSCNPAYDRDVNMMADYQVRFL